MSVAPPVPHRDVWAALVQPTPCGNGVPLLAENIAREHGGKTFLGLQASHDLSFF